MNTKTMYAENGCTPMLGCLGDDNADTQAFWDAEDAAAAAKAPGGQTPVAPATSFFNALTASANAAQAFRAPAKAAPIKKLPTAAPKSFMSQYGTVLAVGAGLAVVAFMFTRKK